MGRTEDSRGFRHRLARLLRGAVTLVAFTESGQMRRLRLANRVVVVAILLLLILLVGAGASVLQLYRGQIDLARMTYLEAENRSLSALLQGQAEQLSRLKLEVVRLKEFEQSLRVVSGMDAPEAPIIGTGQTRGAKPVLPKKR